MGRRRVDIESRGRNAQAIAAATTCPSRPRGREIPDGFRVTAMASVAVPVERLYGALVDPIERKRWLPDIELRERTATAPKSARFDRNGGPQPTPRDLRREAFVESTASLNDERLAYGADATG